MSDADESTTTTDSPISPVNTNRPQVEGTTGIQPEIALCLSGGGYRAMIFHVGAIIRLNEIGLLKRLKRISSVSGGSITSAVLGLNWKKLAFNDQGVATNLDELFINPVRAFGRITIDAESIIGGLIDPFHTIGDKVANAYRNHLFGQATLQDLPEDSEGPRFVINSTNVQTGALWRFSRPFMGDWKVGLVKNPPFPLAQAVTASSAFPPVLSPIELDLAAFQFEPDPNAPLQKSPFTTRAVLTDGGVYDNMGLETAWKHSKTLLVSDAGAPFKPEEDPHTDWTRHAIRVLDLVDNQVRSQRKIALIKALKEKTEHDGAYWGIHTDITAYPKPGSLDCPPDHVDELAKTPTRLAGLDDDYQARLINWGYAIAAAALDSHFPGPVDKPAQFPFPNGV